MIDKIKRILRLTAWFTLCCVFVLVILKPFGTQINFDKGLTTISLVFIILAGVFMISSGIGVFMNLLRDDGSTKGYMRDMAFLWIFNIVMITVLEGALFGEEYYLISIPTTIYISSIILAFQTLCYWIRNLYRERNELQAINEMLRQHQERETKQGDDYVASHDEKQCVLHSDYNDQDITLNPRNFIYVESVGNYANVCYIDNEQLTTTARPLDACKARTIRTTIKQLKEDLSGNDFIVQCHRGFLVNLEYVESMEGANGRVFLNMFYAEKKIPVSRAYKTTIKETLTLNKNCS